jgi:hypothetical protein
MPWVCHWAVKSKTLSWRCCAFLSYRQISDAERQRVRALAERLRSSGISVILDQCFLEASSPSSATSRAPAKPSGKVRMSKSECRGCYAPIRHSKFVIRHSHATIADALAHLRSCPQGNDPLQFIFGDLLARFTPEEERIVATLSYPAEPVTAVAIGEISGVDDSTPRSSCLPRVLPAPTGSSIFGKAHLLLDARNVLGFDVLDQASDAVAGGVRLL